MSMEVVADGVGFGDVEGVYPNLASRKRRLAGYLLNGGLLAVSALVVGSVLGVVAVLTRGDIPEVLLMALGSAPFLIWFYIVAEVGQTPGKALLGLRVYSDITGEAIGRKRMFMRELVLPGMIVLFVTALGAVVDYVSPRPWVVGRGLASMQHGSVGGWRDVFLSLLMWLPELLILGASRKRLVDMILGTHVRYEQAPVAQIAGGGERSDPIYSVNPNLRVEALRNMRGLDNAEVFERLHTGLADHLWFVRRTAAEEIRHYAADLGDVGALLATALQDRDPRVVEAATITAGAVGNVTVLPELHSLLTSEVRGVRHRAIAAIDAIRNPSSVPVLIEVLRTFPEEQITIIEILARFRAAAQPAVPYLGELIADRYCTRDVARPVALALLSIGGAEARVILERLLADETHPATHAVRDIVRVNGLPR